MTEVWFYHLQLGKIENLLPEILEKTLQNNWKALVHMENQKDVSYFDQYLWTYRDSSFLPHGTDNYSETCQEQDILLTTGWENKNQADILILVDSGNLTQIQNEFNRVIILFNGQNEEKRAWARTLWQESKKHNWTPVYWKEEGVKKWKKIVQ